MLRPFEYFSPETLAEATELLAGLGPRARALAGGTALLVWLERGQRTADAVVNLKRIPGLRELSFDVDRGLTVGALVTLDDLIASELVRSRCPALARTASQMATPQVRNLATVGGNVCGAAPAADLAVTLVALGAVVRLAGPRGDRTTPLHAFFEPWGAPALLPGEILTTIHIPPGGAASYRKFMVRQAADAALANVAVWVDRGDAAVAEARIAVGASGPRPARMARAEGCLRGRPLDTGAIDEAVSLTVADVYPADDHIASRWFRRELIGVLTRRALQEVASAW